MEKQQFEPTQGLLDDVMTKQAGTVAKAVLEGVMNSTDAGADNITVTVEEEKITITDDGSGMTEAEINKYFKQFGLKDTDIEDKEFGKFRIGRGQLFTFGENVWQTNNNILIVNIGEDESNVTVNGEEYNLDTSDLGFHVAESDNYYEGCSVEVNLYDSINVDETVKEVKKLTQFIPWVHNVDLTVNGEEVHQKPENYVESDHAYFVFDPSTQVHGVMNYSSDTQIYNQGAYIKSENLSKTSSLIISKNDLDVNFARNDILQTDPLWDGIVESFEIKLVEYLLNHKEDNLSMKEAIWILETAADNELVMMRAREEPLIEDIFGNQFSLNELSNETITFTHTRNDQAKSLAGDSDVVFINDRYQPVIRDLVDNSKLVNYADAVQDSSSFEMSHIKEDNLSKRRQKNLDRARWFLDQCGFNGEVKGGYSRHADIWKDDDNTLFIHKGTLNTSKKEYILVTLEEVLREASFKGSTIESADENLTFRRNYADYSQDKGEYQLMLLENKIDL